MTTRPRSKQAPVKKQQSPEQRLKVLLENPSDDLTWYFEVGKLVEAIAPRFGGMHHGQAMLETLVERYGKLRPALRNLLHSTRHFAGVYRRSDLPRLSKVSWSHVARLASIGDPKIRERLEVGCLANKWTFLQLKFHCLEAVGLRPSGGSTAKQIEDVGPISTLSETIRLTDEWLHSFQRRIEPAESSLGRALRSKHRGELRALVSRALEGITRLQDAAEKSRRKLQKLSKEIERAE